MVDIMTDYRLWRATATGELIETIDDFGSFEFTSIYNDAGGWVLTTGGDIGGRLQKGENVYLRREAANGQPGRVVAGGPWTERTTQTDTNGRIVTVSGGDENSLLARRVVWPAPADNTPPFSPAHYIPAGDRISTTLCSSVSDHLGPTALPERQHPGLTIATDPVVGCDSTGAGRLDNLLDFMRSLVEVADWWLPSWDGVATVLVIVPGVWEIALGPPVRFRISQNVFSVEACRDLSRQIVWGVSRGNASSASILERAPEANAVIVGGQGDLTARAFVLGEDPDTINTWGRIERFVDRRDTATLSASYARFALAETPEVAAVEVVVSDAADTWLTGWDLGDTATIAADGVTTIGQIAKVSGSLTVDGGLTIIPTVGQVGALSQLPAVNRQTNNLDRRLSLQERQ